MRSLWNRTGTTGPATSPAPGACRPPPADGPAEGIAKCRQPARVASASCDRPGRPRRYPPTEIPVSRKDFGGNVVGLVGRAGQTQHIAVQRGEVSKAGTLEGSRVIRRDEARRRPVALVDCCTPYQRARPVCCPAGALFPLEPGKAITHGSRRGSGSPLGTLSCRRRHDVERQRQLMDMRGERDAPLQRRVPEPDPAATAVVPTHRG
jgi:hypothetical protein